MSDQPDSDNTTVELQQETLDDLVHTIVHAIDVMDVIPDIADERGQNRAMHHLGERMDDIIHHFHNIEKDSTHVEQALDEISDGQLDEEALKEAIAEKLEEAAAEDKDNDSGHGYIG